MESTFLTLASSTYGLIFLGVLAEFVGVPFPSSLLLIVAGTLSYEGRFNPILILALTLAAASIGDAIWFTVGKTRGPILLNGYCKISLGSDDCVRRTKAYFARFPGLSLVLGKFVPGLSAFVVPLAGLSGMRYPAFLRFDSTGIVLWAGSMLGIGYWSGESLTAVLGSVRHSRWALWVLVPVFLICFYAIKFWRRKRFGRAKIMVQRDPDTVVDERLQDRPIGLNESFRK